MMTTYTFMCSLIVAALLAVFTNSVNARQIDAEKYRTEKLAAVATFFNKQATEAERLAMVKKLGYPSKQLGVRLFETGQDKTESDAIRLAALQKHRYKENWLELAVSIIADPSESDELASGLVKDISQRTTFRQAAELRQKLQAVLRDRLDDPRKRTRLAAFRTLVASHDQQAIDKLVESLRNGLPPVPLPEAIELLDTDGSTKHIVTLRQFLNHSNIQVRAQLAHALAVDPKSRTTIIAWVTDANVNETIRLNGMRGLAREDESFMSYAIELALNSKESANIRYAALENAMRRMNYQGVDGKTQIVFANAVERLTRVSGVVTSAGKDLGVEAKLLLAHLQKAFPIIGRHYTRRRVS